MILEIIGIMLAVTILSIIINGVEDYCKQSKRVNMSFKEAMDLVELPVVTFLSHPCLLPLSSYGQEEEE